jgi:hypothetical protein
MTNEIVYVYAGRIERGPRYRWAEGYSENGNTHPWVTRREAHQDAAKRGAQAVFVRPPVPGQVRQKETP